MIGEDPLREYMESFFDDQLPRIITWTASGDDCYFGHEITLQFSSEAEIEALSALITESEAALILNERCVIAYNKAVGRPFFAHDISQTVLEQIGIPLEEGQYIRVHPITYSAGRKLPSPDEDRVSVTVNIVVVKDGSVVSTDRSFGVYAHNAYIDFDSAQTVDRNTLDNDYTSAIAFTSEGLTFVPEIEPAQVVADINATQINQTPREVPVIYSFSPGSDIDSVTKDVVVTVGNILIPTGQTLPIRSSTLPFIAFTFLSGLAYLLQRRYFAKRFTKTAALD